MVFILSQEKQTEEIMPPKRRKASVDRDDDPSPSGTPATKRRKKSALNYDPVCEFHSTHVVRCGSMS